MAGDFAAIIDWGSGHETIGTVTQVSGTNEFSISGSYTYPDTGTQSAHVYLYDSTGLVTSDTATINVTATPLDVTAAAQVPIDDLNAGDTVQVAQFTDAGNPAAVSADFTATMTWGGASCDCTVVPADGGGFDVYASTTTPFAGSSAPITIAVSEADGALGSADVTSLAFDSGGTTTMNALPTNNDVTVTGGSELIVTASASLNMLTVVDASVNGLITATSSVLDAADIGQLVGRQRRGKRQRLRVVGGDRQYLRADHSQYDKRHSGSGRFIDVQSDGHEQRRLGRGSGRHPKRGDLGEHGKPQ